MKKFVGVLALCLALQGCSGQEEDSKVAEKAPEAVVVEKTESVATVPADKLATFNDKLSYSIGLDIGKSLQTLGDDIQLPTIYMGLTDAFKGETPLLTPEEIEAVQKEFAAKMQALQMQKLEDMKQANIVAGAAYLEGNKAKEGVQVTESGLQYEVLVAAEGPKPVLTDTVKVDYVGTLIDGTEFDSSVKRGEPAVFGLNQVIAGWGEAVQLMSIGSKYRFVIPAELAYGENGAPPVIEPNAVLVFEVELISIETVEETPINDPAEVPEPAVTQ